MNDLVDGIETAGLTVICAGIDLVSVGQTQRMVKPDDEALDLVFDAAERAHAGGDAASYALSLAGKEAVAKALGTGMEGLRWTEITALSRADGDVLVRLRGAAAERAASAGIVSWCGRWFAIDDDQRAVLVVGGRPDSS